MKIKQHEDKVNSLKTQKNNFEDSLRNMKGTKIMQMINGYL